MVFEQRAKNLLQKAAPQTFKPEPSDNKNKNFQALMNAGFSPAETCRELRELYDSCDDDEKSIKRQILEMIVKMNGMMTPEEQGKAAPIFVIQVNGDNTRVNTMLCPGF
jgi:Holliday junction resolvasome RuvABC DNA-binding subunit